MARSKDREIDRFIRKFTELQLTKFSAALSEACYWLDEANRELEEAELYVDKKLTQIWRKKNARKNDKKVGKTKSREESTPSKKSSLVRSTATPPLLKQITGGASMVLTQ